ncbi:hypothetical protein [Clostridium hydrogeniformans]|uniref:hypothetical protein n=1 Tax=Clostridium hydrogeniformans TaxID=349933 RepID=UPI000489CB28|nr:hypothetical protein [Clostridium hydrogeniformans]
MKNIEIFSSSTIPEKAYNILLEKGFYSEEEKDSDIVILLGDMEDDFSVQVISEIVDDMEDKIKIALLLVPYEEGNMNFYADRMTALLGKVDTIVPFFTDIQGEEEKSLEMVKFTKGLLEIIGYEDEENPTLDDIKYVFTEGGFAPMFIIEAKGDEKFQKLIESLKIDNEYNKGILSRAKKGFFSLQGDENLRDEDIDFIIDEGENILCEGADFIFSVEENNELKDSARIVVIGTQVL